MKEKKTTILVICLVLIALIGAIALTGCSNPRKMASTFYEEYANVAENATYINGEKTMNKMKLKGAKDDKSSMIVDLGSEVTFNTITLGEKTKAVTSFKIEESDDNSDYETIFEGDTIEDFRGCFVGDTDARYLKITVMDASDKYEINDLKVYNNINEGTSKRVASYFLLDRLNAENLDALETVTDIIVFTFTRFDKDGNVICTYWDPESKRDLSPEEAEALFAKNLGILRTKVTEIESAQHRKINIFPTILMPASDDPDDANKYANVIMDADHVKNTAKNVSDFVNKYDLDGVDFDYEYPYKAAEHKKFDNFLIEVKAAIGKDKILSTALGAWNIKMSKDAIAALDQVQLMSYDMFDSHGYHGAFNSSMVRDLDVATKKGIPVEKINMGIPFYSRPLSRAGYWGDYFRFYSEGLITSKYINIINDYEAVDSGGNTIKEPEYFNGYQMVQDKTAFAIDAPVGGIMMWHYQCDIPYDNDLSLFRAIHKTFEAKKASLHK